jgi:aspartate carbamoyltransferase catalytic subunit
VKDVSSNYLNYLLKEAEDMKVMVIKNGGDERLKHRVLASVFYEVR